MNIFAYVIIIIICFLIQFTIVPLLSIRDITPDLILIMVISFAFRMGQFWGVLVGCIAGLFWDIFGTEIIGLSSLSKTIAGFVAGFLGRERIERRLSVLTGLLFITTFIHDIVYYSILTIGTSASLWKILVRFVIPKTLYTVIIAIMIHLIWPQGLWGKFKKIV